MKKIILAVVSMAALAMSSSSWAQITFAPLEPQEVPLLSPVMMAVLGAVLLFAAVKWLQVKGSSKLAATVLALGLSGGGVAGGVFWVEQVEASKIPVVPITDSSGATIPLNVGIAIYSNQSGVTLEVVSINDSNCSDLQPGTEGEPMCQVGTTLADGEACSLFCVGAI